MMQGKHFEKHPAIAEFSVSASGSLSLWLSQVRATRSTGVCHRTGLEASF